MDKPSVDVDRFQSFSIIEENIGIQNDCYLYIYNDMTVLEARVRNISTGKQIYSDFMKVIGGKVFWHQNALSIVDPTFSPNARLKIEKSIKNKAFL